MLHTFENNIYIYTSPVPNIDTSLMPIFQAGYFKREKYGTWYSSCVPDVAMYHIIDYSYVRRVWLNMME